MIRPVLALLLLASVALAAPVPKRDPPKALTPEMVVGTWHYEWNNLLNGVITFSPDGTYSAQHDPRSTMACCGTWRIEGECALVLDETMYNTATGNTRYCGPFRFEFELAKYPTLKGLSGGTTHVLLSNPKR